jgi:hypothetical protein
MKESANQGEKMHRGENVVGVPAGTPTTAEKTWL